MREAITAFSLFLSSFFLVPSLAEAQYKEISRGKEAHYSESEGKYFYPVIVSAKLNYTLGGESFEEDLRAVENQPCIYHLTKKTIGKVFIFTETSRMAKELETLLLGRIGDISHSLAYFDKGVGEIIDKKISREYRNLQRKQDDLDLAVLEAAARVFREGYDLGQVEKQYTQGMWDNYYRRTEQIKKKLSRQSKNLGQQKKSKRERYDELFEEKEEEISYLTLNWLSQIRNFSDSQLERILCYGDYSDIDLPFWEGAGYIVSSTEDFTLLCYTATAIEYSNRAMAYLEEKNCNLTREDLDKMVDKGFVLSHSIGLMYDYFQDNASPGCFSSHPPTRELFEGISIYNVDGRTVPAAGEQKKIQQIKEWQSQTSFNFLCSHTVDSRRKFLRKLQQKALKEHK